MHIIINDTSFHIDHLKLPSWASDVNYWNFCHSTKQIMPILDAWCRKKLQKPLDSLNPQKVLDLINDLKQEDGNSVVQVDDQIISNWYSLLKIVQPKLRTAIFEGAKRWAATMLEPLSDEVVDALYDACRNHKTSRPGLHIMIKHIMIKHVPLTNKIEMIKLVRDLTGLSLYDSKGMVDKTPFAISIKSSLMENTRAMLDNLGIDWVED